MRPWLFPACNGTFKLLMRAFSDLDVEGRENMPKSGPMIIVSNHLGNLDPPIVASLAPAPPAFLAKKELFTFPLNLFMLPYGAHPVDRSKADMEALGWARGQLGDGRPVLLFPEGTRSRGRGLLKAKSGAALLAVETGVPVVPIGLAGTERLQSLLKLLKPTADIDVKIGRSFIVKPEHRSRDRRLMLGVTNEIMDRIARLLPERYRGAYSELANLPYEFTEDAARPAVEPVA